MKKGLLDNQFPFLSFHFLSITLLSIQTSSFFIHPPFSSTILLSIQTSKNTKTTVRMAKLIGIMVLMVLIRDDKGEGQDSRIGSSPLSCMILSYVVLALLGMTRKTFFTPSPLLSKIPLHVNLSHNYKKHTKFNFCGQVQSYQTQFHVLTSRTERYSRCS